MNVAIVSPEAEMWSGEAELVVARSPEGEFGIMRGHIPFLAALVPGRVAVVTGGERVEFFVPGGFLEASGPMDDYHVFVLADDAESLEDIDIAEAKRRLEELQRRRDQEEDPDRLAAQVRAAVARVEVAENRS